MDNFDCPHEGCWFWHPSYCGREFEPLGWACYCQLLGSSPAKYYQQENSHKEPEE
jgi:hypothetical protein